MAATLLATFALAIVVVDGVPIDAPYIDLLNNDSFTAFASFDGDQSDALALRPGIDTSDAAEALSFEIIYRHPITSQQGMPDVAQQNLFSVESDNGKQFNYCGSHPLKRWSKPFDECAKLKTLKDCLGGTTASIKYANSLQYGPAGDTSRFGFKVTAMPNYNGEVRSDLRGAQITKSSWNDILTMTNDQSQCKLNAQTANDCPLAVNHVKECSWRQSWTQRQSIRLTMRTTQVGGRTYPYPQFSYVDNRRASYNDQTNGFDTHAVYVPGANYYSGDGGSVAVDKSYADADLGNGKGAGVNMAAWHHVIVNINTKTSTVDLYVDGASSPIRVVDADDFNSTKAKRFFNLIYLGGKPNGGFGFVGDIAKFRVYSDTLPSSNITALFKEGIPKTKDFVALDFPGTAADALSLAPQFPVNYVRQAKITSSSLHLDGNDFLLMPDLHLTSAFTVEAVFKIEYESRLNWNLCNWGNNAKSIQNRFFIRRLNDGSDAETPDKIEIGVSRDLDHLNKPFTKWTFKLVQTEAILVPGVWHHIVVSVSDNYDVMVRVDGQLVTHGSFFTRGQDLVNSNVTFNTNYLGAANPNANWLPGNIAMFNVFAGSLGYQAVRTLYQYPQFNNVVPLWYSSRLRYAYNFNIPQASMVVVGKGLQNRGTSFAKFNDADRCVITKTEYCQSEAITAPKRKPDNNQPTRDSDSPFLRYLINVTQPYARFAGVQRGSGMQLAPLTLSGQGTTVELIYRHNNFTSEKDDTAKDHDGDVILDFRNTGANNDNICSGTYTGTDASFGSCADKVSKTDCVPKANNNKDKVGIPLPGGGAEWNFQKNGCRWRYAQDDDTFFTLKFRKIQPASELSTTPMLALQMVFSDPAQSTTTKRHYLQITGEPFDVDGDFQKWHHVFVTVTQTGRWIIYMDDRVVSGNIVSPKFYGGKVDAHRPGFITNQPLPAITFDKVHVGSFPNGYNTFQGDIIAFRVYDEALGIFKVVQQYSKRFRADVFGVDVGVQPVANYTFQDPVWAAGAVKYSATTEEQRTSAFNGRKGLFFFGGNNDNVILPKLTVPRAMTVSIMFKVPWDLEAAPAFGLLSMSNPLADTPDNSRGFKPGPYTERFEIAGVNKTHARVTSQTDTKWVEWKGNWNMWFNGANLLVVTRAPSGAVHARLNGRVLMHGAVDPIAADLNDMATYSQNFINSISNGYNHIVGQYSHVRIYDGCFGYDQVQKMFTDDIDGNRDKLRYEWTFAPDPADTVTLSKVTETVSGAHGVLNPNGDVTVRVSYVKPATTWTDFAYFSGEANDALVLPPMTLDSTTSGLSIETMFQYTDPCPFRNAAFCKHIRDTCTHTFPEYAEAVLNAQVNYPGLEGCITSMCCYCEYGSSKEDECATQKIDLGFFEGGATTVNSMCLLVNNKRFAPAWVTSDKGVRPISYRQGCAEYDNCPFVREGWQAGAGGQWGTRGTSTALCSALDSACPTNDTTKIVIGSDTFEECLEGICCFCDNGRSKSDICTGATAAYTFTWNYGRDGMEKTSINTMCRKSVASENYDHKCLDSPFNAERFNFASIFTLSNEGSSNVAQCTGIDSKDDELCGQFRDRMDNTVSEFKAIKEACCGIDCTSTKGGPGTVGFDASIFVNKVGTADIDTKCQFLDRQYDDKTLKLMRQLQPKQFVKPGEPRLGFMQTVYSDRSLFKINDDGIVKGHNIGVNGEPITAGSDFDKWHHVIINVETDGSWTYWVNGQVRSGQRALNNRGFGPILASPGSVKIPDGRSQMPSTLFDSNSLGIRMEGRIGRLKIWKKTMTHQQITNLYTKGVFPSDTPAFDLETYSPEAFGAPGTPASRSFINRYSQTGLRFDSHADKSSSSHDYIGLPDVKFPSAFTVRMVIQPHIATRTLHSSLFGVSTPHSSGEVNKFGSSFVIARTNNNGVAVQFKRCESCVWTNAKTKGNLLDADTIVSLHVMVTNDDKITIMINHIVANHGDPRGSPAIAGNEIQFRGTNRINSNIWETAYPNPMTLYTLLIYEGAQPYKMDFSTSKLRYNWTFADEKGLLAKRVPQSGAGYPGFECTTTQMTMFGNPIPMRTPGRKLNDCVPGNGVQCWIPTHLQPWSMTNWKDFPQDLNKKPTNKNVDRVAIGSDGTKYDLGENGTTFEVLFNASQGSGVNFTQHLFDLRDNGPDGIAQTADDRRMRLFNSRQKVEGSQNWYQNRLTFEWSDGDRLPIADNLQQVAGKSFGFRLNTAPLDVKDWTSTWHHVIVTVNADGNWHMWQDGQIVSGYFAKQRASPNGTLYTQYLAHPGYVTAEPICRFNARGKKASCNTQFANLTVGGVVSGDKSQGFRGDISAFRILQHAVTPDEAYAMYWQGMDHGAYDITRYFEVDWIPCKSSNAVGDQCNDRNGQTVNDRCRSNMLCKGSFSVDNGTADCNERGQCNFTSAGDLQRAPTASPTPSPVAAPTSPPTSTDSSSSSSATATGSVIIGVVVFIVILVAIVALFLVYRSKKAKQDDHKVVSFENPMYDDTENVASAAAGNDGGYMDVPMKHNPTFNESDEEDNHGGNGYLDVQPNGEDEDEDDNEEDI